MRAKLLASLLLLLLACPVAATPGGWQVNLRSYRTVAKAQTAQLAWEQKGYPADIESVIVEGKSWQRLRIPGFATEHDARSFATRFGDAWISRS